METRREADTATVCSLSTGTRPDVPFGRESHDHRHYLLGHDGRYHYLRMHLAIGDGHDVQVYLTTSKERETDDLWHIGPVGTGLNER